MAKSGQEDSTRYLQRPQIEECLGIPIRNDATSSRIAPRSPAWPQRAFDHACDRHT